jgi:hypothetical protein
MDRIRQSAAFRALSREQAEMAEEMLFTGFGGLNRIPMKVVQGRIESLIKEVRPEDETGLRQVVLGVIEAA